jgi:hypothetical protein
MSESQETNRGPDEIQQWAAKLESRIVGKWLVIWANGYHAWQVESRQHFDIHLETHNLNNYFEETIADLRDTEKEAWELVLEKHKRAAAESAEISERNQAYITSKIHRLTSTITLSSPLVEKAISEAYMAGAFKANLYPNHTRSQYDADGMNEAKKEFVDKRMKDLLEGALRVNVP